MTMNRNDVELFTSEIIVEAADNSGSSPKRAVIKIPLINEGSNSKFLLWTQETMEKVAHMFRGVPFRFDLNGQNEGSHTRDKLSSPFYDVGWTYSDEKGAYYDPEKKTIWVQGEVTHPEVIEKLMRQTSDGKREINFASMGAMIDPKDTACSICGRAPFGNCNHTRGKEYNGQSCNMVPQNISKALHVALTNDPADKVAEIAEAIFQDMSSQVDNPRQESPVGVAPNLPGPNNADQSDLKEMIEKIIQEVLAKKALEKSKISELADNGETKMEDKKKKKIEDDDVKEKVEKNVEEKTTQKLDDSKEKSLKKETAEEVDEKEDEEDKKKKKKESKSVETKEEFKEKEFAEAEEKEKEGSEEDEEEDEEEAKKKKKKKSEDPKEEKEDAKEDKKPEMADDFEFKITGPLAAKQNKVELQDNSVAPQAQQIIETADNNKIYAEKYKTKLRLEVADAYVRYNKVKSKDEAILVLQDKSIEQLELLQDAFDGIVIPQQQEVKAKPTVVLQDNVHVANQKFANAVPEFGGFVHDADPYVEVQDMSASDRKKKFGEYGAFDVCFNPNNAQKYRK